LKNLSSGSTFLVFFVPNTFFLVALGFDVTPKAFYIMSIVFSASILDSSAFDGLSS